MPKPKRHLKISPRAVEYARPMLETWLAYQVHYRELPSLSVGIVHGNKLLFSRGFGYADIAKRDPATSKTVYQIASISKLFTATAVMQLVQDKRLDLDQPVSKYLKWFRSSKDPQMAKVTLRQILTHTGGVTRDGEGGQWVNDRFPNERQLRQTIQSGRLLYRPNRHYKYSNVGLAVLAFVIAEVTGMPYRQYVYERILEPLGMKRTDILPVPGIRKIHARGYGLYEPKQGRKPFPVVADAKALAGATGFSSNVEDLARFISAHFIGNKTVLSDRSKREMQRAQWKEPDGYKVGLGFEQRRRGPFTTIGHSGGYAGFSTRLEFHQPSQIGVIVLCNTINGPTLGLAGGILNVLSRYSKRGSEPEKRLVPLEGIYGSRWGDDGITPRGSELFEYDPYSLFPLLEASQLKPDSGRKFTVTSDSAHAMRKESARFIPARGKPNTFYTAGFPAKRRRIRVPISK